MDNRFLKDDLTERYVLNQLNDEELANFRGRLMFDETLRKQVVETKMLMNGLATIAGKSVITNPVSTSKVVQMPTSNNRMLRAAMVIGVLMLAGLSYHFYNSSTTSTMASSSMEKQPQEKMKPIQVDEVSTEAENSTESISNDVDEKDVEEVKKPRIFASAEKKTVIKETTEVEVAPEPEMAFGAPNTTKVIDNIPANFFEEDEKENMGFAYAEEEVNEFIEDAITNSTTKSSIGIVKIKDFENSKVITRNKFNAIRLNLEGTIDTKAGNNKKYVFKVFDNNTDAFINNTPKFQKHLKPLLLGTEQYDFKIEGLIELQPGLHYFTIEEEVNDEQDMIYAGRFYVSAGKFHVE